MIASPDIVWKLLSNPELDLTRVPVEVIAAADQHGIAMVFTGRRLFRH